MNRSELNIMESSSCLLLKISVDDTQRYISYIACCLLNTAGVFHKFLCHRIIKCRYYLTHLILFIDCVMCRFELVTLCTNFLSNV